MKLVAIEQFIVSCRTQTKGTSEAEGEVGYPLYRFKPPVISYITDHSKKVLLIGFLCLLVFVPVSVLFSPSVCLNDI